MSQHAESKGPTFHCSVTVPAEDEAKTASQDCFKKETLKVPHVKQAESLEFNPISCREIVIKMLCNRERRMNTK